MDDLDHAIGANPGAQRLDADLDRRHRVFALGSRIISNNKCLVADRHTGRNLFSERQHTGDRRRLHAGVLVVVAASLHDVEHRLGCMRGQLPLPETIADAADLVAGVALSNGGEGLR